MRVIEIITSTICAILIIICSIAQFHHHDYDGKMVVYSFSANVSCNHIEKHNTTDSHGSECNTRGHGCHDGNHQGEKNCSLKINIVKPENKQFSKIIIACMVIADLVLNTCDIIQTIYVPTNAAILSNDNTTILSLRAPPVL